MTTKIDGMGPFNPQTKLDLKTNERVMCTLVYGNILKRLDIIFRKWQNDSFLPFW